MCAARSRWHAPTIPNSATAQFFINLRTTPSSTSRNARDGHGYAVFGKVVDGMEVVDKIRAVKTSGKGRTRTCR